MFQNIAGRAICDAMLVPVTYDKGAKSGYKFVGNVRKGEPSNIFWRVSKADLVQWGITEDDIMDCVKQLEDMGTIDELRDQLGILPGQGYKNVGLTVRSRTKPAVQCHAIVNSRTAYGNPEWGCGNMTSPSNFGDYGQVIECFFYYDIHHEVVKDGEDMSMIGDINTLLFGSGIKFPTVV